MDNFYFVIKGITIGSKILEIKLPEIRLFMNEDINDNKINALFLKEQEIIAFNELWIDNAKSIEIMITCFHETRHAFQHEVITGKYKGSIVIDDKTRKKWIEEFKDYKSLLNSNSKDKYVIQDIEIDAIAFAHQQMLDLFQVETVVPDFISGVPPKNVSDFK